MSGIKVYYFDARGRAEVIRLVLTLADQKFEDVRFTGEEFQNKYKGEAPFGQAPFIEYNGKPYGQSNAIARFFANEFGLYGKNNLERLRVDEVTDLVSDMMNVLVKVFMEKDEAKKAELQKKAKDEDIPKFCGFFSKLLKENGGKGCFVGSELTLADLQVFSILYNVGKAHECDLTQSTPELKALADKVTSNPRLKKYLAERKDTKM